MSDGFAFSRFWLTLWTSVVAILVLAPLLVVVLVSLTPLNYLSLPSGGLSLRWYASLGSHPEFLGTAVGSLELALAAAATSLVLGVLVALALVRFNFPLRVVVELLSASPLFIPMVMSALAILIFFSEMGWTNQVIRMYVAHVAITLPYVIRTVTISLGAFDTNQELAAQNLGANPVRAFLLITLPQLGPGLFAGAVFAFIVSFDNVGMAIFLAGPQFSTLPVELFTYASYNNDPTAAAVSVLMMVFSVSVVALLERFFGLQRLLGSTEKAA